MDKKSKKKSMLIAMAAIFVSMLGLIFVTVLLTGERETSEFTEYDKIVFITFVVTEVALVTALMVLAVKVGRLNNEEYSQRMKNAKNEMPVQRKLRNSNLTMLYISLAIIAVLYIVGMIFNKKIDDQVRKSLFIIVGIAGCALVLFVIVSFCISMFFSKKLSQMKIAEGQKLLESQRENAEITVKNKLKTLRGIKAAADVYAIFLFLLGILLTFIGGLVSDVAYFSCIPVILSFVLIRSAIMQLPAPSSFTDLCLKETQLLSKEEFPLIYQAAVDAENHLGIKKNIKIFWTNQEDMSSVFVVETKTGINLLVDVFLLNIFTEKELYATFLHEFAHETKTQKNMHVNPEYCYRLLYAINSVFIPQEKLLFVLFDVSYSWNFSLYNYASSIILEENADESMKDGGKDAVSALAKLKYKDLWEWEEVSLSASSFYENEEIPENSYEENIELFKKSLKERQSKWNELAKIEIISKNASHPTIYSRIRKLGDYDFPNSVEFPEGDYSKECLSVLQKAERALANALSTKYTELRNENYVKPIKTVVEFEEGLKVEAETYRDIIMAYDSLRNFSKAMEVADMAIEKLPKEASHFAYYYRGHKKLHMYDKTGIDDLYTAIEENSNYVESALEDIGSFCCLTGLREELENYRSKAEHIMQNYSDGAAKGFYLEANDKIGPEQLPEGMLENILGYIKSIDKDCIEHVYLVRKTVSAECFFSAFIVEFCQETDNEVKNDIMHKIFIHLDTTDWQFSLFEFPEVPKALQAKVRRECVYERH